MVRSEFAGGIAGKAAGALPGNLALGREILPRGVPHQYLRAYPGGFRAISREIFSARGEIAGFGVFFHILPRRYPKGAVASLGGKPNSGNR